MPPGKDPGDMCDEATGPAPLMDGEFSKPATCMASAF